METATHREKNAPLAMGDKLYKYVSFRGIGVYEVCGFVDDFILVKSTFCGKYDGKSNNQCIIKINNVDGAKDVYKYVRMMQSCGSDTYTSTDDDGDEVEIDNSYMWHTCDDGFYYVSKKKCASERGNKLISDYRKRIEDKKSKIVELQSDIDNMENHINNVESWINGVELK